VLPKTDKGVMRLYRSSPVPRSLKRIVDAEPVMLQTHTAAAMHKNLPMNPPRISDFNGSKQ
jgi:hypothetical protein